MTHIDTAHPANDISGLYFHSFSANGIVGTEGRVLARREDGSYEVILRNMFTGDFDTRIRVTLKETRGWWFYPTLDDLEDAVRDTLQPALDQHVAQLQASDDEDDPAAGSAPQPDLDAMAELVFKLVRRKGTRITAADVRTVLQRRFGK